MECVSVLENYSCSAAVLYIAFTRCPSALYIHTASKKARGIAAFQKTPRMIRRTVANQLSGSQFPALHRRWKNTTVFMQLVMVKALSSTASRTFRDAKVHPRSQTLYV